MNHLAGNLGYVVRWYLSEYGMVGESPSTAKHGNQCNQEDNSQKYIYDPTEFRRYRDHIENPIEHRKD